MDYQDIKPQANKKVLLRGSSSLGKTYTCVHVAILVAKEGYNVLYVDTETEGAETIVSLVESDVYSEDDVENLDYHQANEYDEFMSLIEDENQHNYALMIVDTLDHKESFAQLHEKDTQLGSEIEWSEWFGVRETEKKVMETLNKPSCNVIATIDPESGSMEKQKGVQTNVHGYFNVVVDMKRHNGEYTNVVSNFVGRDGVIGNTIGQDEPLWNNLKKVIVDRI